MNKKLLSALFIGTMLLGSVGTFTSCSKDYDDDIKDLQEKIDKNTTAINQINTLVSAGSVITNVTKFTSPEPGGVTFTLSNGSTYTVNNGTVGAKGDKGDTGAAGKDAIVWTIGTDGYWYKDGVKTDYKALGVDGTNGTNGTDGVYYKPNVETGCFDIYNADGTLKEATTISWKAASSKVTAIDDGYDVTLYGLADANGNEITAGVKVSKSNHLRSLVFIPQCYVDGVEAMPYDSYTYNALTLTNKDSKAENYTSADGNGTVINPSVYAEYHVNPTNCSETYLKNNLSFFVKTKDFHVTRADATADFNAVPEFVKFENGILTVKVNITGVPATAEKISVIALHAKYDTSVKEDSLTEGVTSDYATVYKRDIEDLGIVNIKKADADYHFRTLINAANQDDPIANKLAAWDDLTSASCDAVVPYDGSLDLNTIVGVHIMNNATKCTKTAADLANLGMTLAYDVVQNYKIGTPETDQKDFITLTDGVLTPKVFTTNGKAAVGRTPIIRVRLMHGSEIVKVAYVKVEIVDKVVSVEPITLTTADFDTFVCEDATEKVQVTVENMNVQVYNKLGLSKTQFRTDYPNFVDYGATKTTKDPGTVVEVTDNTEDQTTIVPQWTLTKDELWANAGKTITHEVRYYTGGTATAPTGQYVDLVLTAKVAGIQKSYNVTSANMISNYWTTDYSNCFFNVAVPEIGSTDPTKCIFVSNINSVFVQDPTSGVMKLSKGIEKIYYYFCSDVKNITTIGSISNVKFTVDNTGDPLTSILKAQIGTGAAETVATINNNDNSVKGKSSIEYNKNSEVAKELLNEGAKSMYTFIGAKTNACNDEKKAIEITFNGQDHFVAYFYRPVNITSKSNGKFIDGVDFGETGSYIKLEDFVAPSDWRTRTFVTYPNYWGYYGPFTITADTQKATCDLNGTVGTIPPSIILKQENATTTIGTTTLTVTPGTIFTEATKSGYGFLTYKNNESTVKTAFNLFVPVNVNYGWGTIKVADITIPVEATTTASGIKAKK